MSRTVELEIPSKPEYLSLVRAVVSTAAALDPMLSEPRIEDLRLAVSEAATNAVEAHAALDGDERVAIRCDLDDDRVEVEVRDRGSGFDLAHDASPPGPEAPDRLEHERGLGLPLMRILADEITIRTADAGTSVRLVVYTSPRRDTAT